MQKKFYSSWKHIAWYKVSADKFEGIDKRTKSLQYILTRNPESYLWQLDSTSENPLPLHKVSQYRHDLMQIF